MTQWTSAMGAAQLARLLNSQQERPAGPGTRRPPAYRALADGIRLLVLEGRVPVAAPRAPQREHPQCPTRTPSTGGAGKDRRRGDSYREAR
ncbi:PLP-dependent aminotransferase family protein, partial [Streptomyces sp. NPDC127044]